MSEGLLLKGFEVELFTGRPDGTNVGVASEVARDLSDFVTEPDHRNLEYITPPISAYEALPEALLQPRRRLREWLAPRGLTLLPGSTLSLGDSSRFERSDPTNPYHDLIETTYGTKVVTASIHQPGHHGPGLLFAAVRLVLRSGLLLSLVPATFSVVSRLATTRSAGISFPRPHAGAVVPGSLPLHAVGGAAPGRWPDAQRTPSLDLRRPNGPRRPYDLYRLELRICDLSTDPAELLAITALLELRLLELRDDPQRLDPLQASELSAEELAELADSNDAAAARSSLEATLQHWQDGRAVTGRAWIAEILEQLSPRAEALGLSERLLPLGRLLESGNQAMRWTAAIEQGCSIGDLLRQGSCAMKDQEESVAPLSGALG